MRLRTLLAGAAVVGGVALANPFDDGIAGCIKTGEGRLHFQMDDGSISAEPVSALQDDGNNNCTISHGGGSAPDLFERVDVAGSDYAVNLVKEAAAFSNETWETVQPLEQEFPFETYTAYLDGEDIVLADQTGVPAKGILAIDFSETLSSVSTSPEMAELDDETVGSAIFAYETDEGIQVGRVPAVNVLLSQALN